MRFSKNVWVMHMQAAVVLVAVALAYTIYMVRSGLGAHTVGQGSLARDFLVEGRQDGCVNIVCTGLLRRGCGADGSGGLMYFGHFAGDDVATLHWYATWVIIGFAAFISCRTSGSVEHRSCFASFGPRPLSAARNSMPSNC